MDRYIRFVKNNGIELGVCFLIVFTIASIFVSGPNSLSSNLFGLAATAAAFVYLWKVRQANFEGRLRYLDDKYEASVKTCGELVAENTRFFRLYTVTLSDIAELTEQLNKAIYRHDEILEAYQGLIEENAALLREIDILRNPEDYEQEIEAEIERINS